MGEACLAGRSDLRTMEVFENRAGQWLLLTVLENAAAVSQPPFDATTFRWIRFGR